MPEIVTEPVYQFELRNQFIEQNPDFVKQFPFSNNKL